MYLEFLRIHPFRDGNGRLGRVLYMLLMLEHDLLPVVFQALNREDYLRELFCGGSRVIETQEGHFSQAFHPGEWHQVIHDAMWDFLQGSDSDESNYDVK